MYKQDNLPKIDGMAQLTWRKKPVSLINSSDPPDSCASRLPGRIEKNADSQTPEQEILIQKVPGRAQESAF